MCGIAGLIHRDGATSVGKEMTAMLQSLKHRGPDSTGFAIYGLDGRRICHAPQARRAGGHDQGPPYPPKDQGAAGRGRRMLAELGAETIEDAEATPYAFRYRLRYAGDMRRLAADIEQVEGAEILSFGSALELIKDLGDAARVSEQYGLGTFPRHAWHRPHPHGDGIRRRHPLGPSLLGLSLQRHLGRAQRPAHQLLDHAPRDGAARPPLHVELRLRADRRLHRRQSRAGRDARGR